MHAASATESAIRALAFSLAVSLATDLNGLARHGRGHFMRRYLPLLQTSSSGVEIVAVGRLPKRFSGRAAAIAGHMASVSRSVGQSGVSRNSEQGSLVSAPMGCSNYYRVRTIAAVTQRIALLTLLVCLTATS